jgi:hypothetical protein
MQDGKRPLHVAIEKGHTAVVKALVDAGAYRRAKTKVRSCWPP